MGGVILPDLLLIYPYYFLYTPISMNNEFSDNDEPIHHSEGKDYNYSCPSSLTFAQSGASSSPINISPPISISPPGMTLVLEQQMLEQGEPHGKLKRYFQRVFKFCNRKEFYVIVVNCGGNILIEDSNIKTLIMKTNK